MMGIACVIHFLIKQGIHQNTQAKNGKLNHNSRINKDSNKNVLCQRCYLFWQYKYHLIVKCI